MDFQSQSKQNVSKQNVLTVSQLTDIVKSVIESSFRSVIVDGEISNFVSSGPGHFYLTLKDSGSQISCAMWRSSTSSLTFRPKNGDKVRCYGYLSVYAPRGNYQLIINKMELAGIGNILQMLEERKRRLAAEGLFDESRKRPLPYFPKTIGVVTSPTGAAIRDIIQRTQIRNPHVSIILYPAMVQGEGSAETIARMIRIANFCKQCDVLIIGRGGGSQEDLLPFSEECVVRAVAESEIPTISAVGHEIDWAICDYAADKRAPTPTGAAEIAVPVFAEIMQNIQYYKDDLYNSISQNVRNKLLMVRAFKPENLEMQFRSIEQPYLMRLENAKREILQNMQDKIRELKQTIQNDVTILEGASPATILNRGYSMVRDSDGNVVRDASQVTVGSELEIVPAKGKLAVEVKSKM